MTCYRGNITRVLMLVSHLALWVADVTMRRAMRRRLEIEARNETAALFYLGMNLKAHS